MELKKAIKKLQDFEQTPFSQITRKEVNKFLDDIRPQVLKLRYGRLVMQKIIECTIEYEKYYESPAYGNAASILKWSVIKSRLWPLSVVMVYPVSMYLIVFGVAAAIAGSVELHTALDSKNWKKTEAIVIKSKIIKRILNSDSDSETYHYEPDIKYVYVIKGVTYTSERLNFQNFALDEPEAKSILKRYPVDRSVDVYYNSQNPKDSVLERKIDATPYSLFFWGAVTSILGFIVLLIRIIRRKRKMARL